MATLGIIAEYNPFHNGHLYHLTKSRNRVNAKRVVVVLSPSFLQRGEPAIVDKWTRTSMALSAGIDLIIELPFPYACSSAEHFARSGIALLETAGCDHISFGIDKGNPADLDKIASILAFETEEFSCLLKKFLATGLSFPQARSEALAEITGRPTTINNLLRGANNILAIEYLKALKIRKSAMKPVFIKRLGTSFHDLAPAEGYASAGAIRNILKNNHYPQAINFLQDLMPADSHAIFKEALTDGRAPIFPEDLGKIIIAKLRCARPKDLAVLPDMEPGLENRFLQAGKVAGSWADLLSNLQTKRYTKTRLQRILTYFLFNLTEKVRKEVQFYDDPPYLRPLGFSNEGKNILKYIKSADKIPIITSIAPRRLPFKTMAIVKSLELERQCTDILALLAPNPQKRQGSRDYRKSPLYFCR